VKEIEYLTVQGLLTAYDWQHGRTPMWSRYSIGVASLMLFYKRVVE